MAGDEKNSPPPEMTTIEKPPAEFTTKEARPDATVKERRPDLTTKESSSAGLSQAPDKTQAVQKPAAFTPAIFPGGAPGLKGVELIRRFPAQGGEADIFLVRKDGKEQVLKLYRWGIEPKIEVLDRIIKLSMKYPDYFVQVYERGYESESKRFFEIEEFCGLGSLNDFLGQRKLEEPDIAKLFEQLAKALMALHDNGILHLDLKPGNILVRQDSPLHVVLTDFGIASILDEEFSKKMTDIKGTSLYQSPESLSGIVGPKSDWWSLGIILLEMLQGKHPFEGLQRQVIYYRLTTSGIPLPKTLPQKWVPVLKGLLTRNPDIRWGETEIRKWLEGGDVKTFFDDENAQAVLDGLVDPSGTQFKRFELPFQFLGKSFFTLEDLLRVFASSPEAWSQAKVNMARGQITKWLEDGKDNERADKLMEIIDTESDPDRMLFRGLYTFYPELPLVWCGKVVDKRLILELMAKACEAGVLGEEEKLLDGLFGEGLFHDFMKMTGKKIEALEEILHLAKILSGTELRNFSMGERCRILLFALQKSFAPDKALDCLQSAMGGDREFVLILQAAGTRGFASFAHRAKIWKKDDETAWKLAGELYSRASYVVTPVLEIMVRMSTVIASSIGKDHSLRDMLFALALKNPMDPDMFERWQNLRDKHRWLVDVAKIVYEIPDEMDCANFIDNKISSKLVNDRWSKISDYILPPFFQKLRDGKFIASNHLVVVREVLPQPRVLIPKGNGLWAWGELEDWLEDLPNSGTKVESYAQLVNLKKEYAATVGLYHQAKIGLLGIALSTILLANYLTPDPFALLALFTFLVSAIWPHLRQLAPFQGFKGKPPFEAVFPNPVLIFEKSPKPFNLFNKVGFALLILRLSIFHQDFAALLKFAASQIWGYKP